MKLLNRLFGDENVDGQETLQKVVDEDYLRFLNDEELDVEFRIGSAQLTRILDNGVRILEAMRERGAEMPQGTALFETIQALSKSEEEVTTDLEKEEKEVELVKFDGPRRPKVLFVGASPSRLDLVRGKLFAGPVGKTLNDTYLPALGVSKSEVSFMNLVPEYLEDKDGNPREPTSDEIQKYTENINKTLEYLGPYTIIPLGKTAAQYLNADVEVWVPHPRAVNIFGDSGEVERKLKKVAGKLRFAPSPVMENATSDEGNSVEKIVDIFKTNDEHQVVLGVVLEPEVEDTDGNWTNTEEIEKTAYNFMVRFQQVGIEHLFKTEDAAIVESYIAPIDFELNGQEVKKGSWVVGVQVFSDDLWKMVKSGDFAGFSFGGKGKVDPSKRLE